MSLKRLEIPDYPSIPFAFNAETGKNKTIVVYGDSFAEAAMQHQEDITNPVNSEADNTIHSWMWYLASFLRSKVITYGVSGGSEALTYDIFKKTQDVPRDATIIYHTHPLRPDNISGNRLEHLKKSDFKNWDSIIPNPTAHLYWSDSLYKFKNGKSFRTTYHITHANDVPPNELWRNNLPNEVEIDARYKYFATNHVNVKGNLLLGIMLTKYFKEELKWNAVF